MDMGADAASCQIKIDAARIDVGELFAQRAFVDALYTSRIYGDKGSQRR